MDEAKRAVLQTFLDGGGPEVVEVIAWVCDDGDDSLMALINWSHSRWWAWNELERRVRACHSDGRALLPLLAMWVEAVAFVIPTKRPYSGWRDEPPPRTLERPPSGRHRARRLASADAAETDHVALPVRAGRWS